MTRTWLIRDAWRSEVVFQGSEQAAATEAQAIATARGVAVQYRAKLDTVLPISEAPTARIRRP